MGSHQLHGFICYVIGQQMGRHPSFAKSHPRTKCGVLLMQSVWRNVLLLFQGSLPELKLVASLMASKSSRRKIPISVHTHGEWKYEEGGRRGYVPFGIFFPVATWSQIQLP